MPQYDPVRFWWRFVARTNQVNWAANAIKQQAEMMQQETNAIAYRIMKYKENLYFRQHSNRPQ